MAPCDGPVVTLDTNIAIYAFSDAGRKAALAWEALARSSFVSVQLLNEFTNVLLRKRGLPWSRVTSLLGSLSESVDLVLPLTAANHREGVRIAQRYKLGIHDALMLAVALGGGARTIYSEDMHHDLVIDDTLRIVDPFR